MIWIVDDNTSLAGNICLLLQQAGHECVHVGSTRKVFNLLRTGRPSLIVLDYDMPGRTSGLGVLRYLHNRPDLKDLPVVVFSANADPVFRNEARSLGVIAFLQKGTDNWDNLVALIGVYVQYPPRSSVRMKAKGLSA
jgi:two-component system, OmpR family, phosphate regulon response regulator PhoB